MKKLKVFFSLFLVVILSFSLVSCQSSEEIAATPQGAIVKNTIDALLAGDYNTANANIVVLGSESEETVAFGASLPKIIFDGLEYELKGLKEPTDTYTLVKVKFKVDDHMQAFQNWFEDISMLTLLNTSAGEDALNDVEFSKASMERLEKQLEETKVGRRTITSDIEVQKIEGEWKIIMNDAFIDNVTGGFATAMKGITKQIQDMVSSQMSK